MLIAHKLNFRNDEYRSVPPKGDLIKQIKLSSTHVLSYRNLINLTSEREASKEA
jgi:hypothetical protein